MKNNLLVLICLLYSILGTAQNFKYAKGAGGKSNDVSNAVCVDGSGLYITGSIKGNATFDSINITSKGEEDVFLARYTDSCTLKWVVTFGGPNEDVATTLHTDANKNIYVAGYFNGTIKFENTTLTSSSADIFLAKYDTAGVFKWAKQAGGKDNDYAYAIHSDTKGNIYLTGDFIGSAKFDSATISSNGMKDIFVAKYDSSGVLVWVKNAGGNKNDAGNSVCVDKKGNTYITGNYTDSANFDNNKLVSKGASDIFIAKYNTQGKNEWVKTAGGKGNDVGNSIVIDDSLNIYVTGNFRDIAYFSDTNVTSNGGADMFLAKYNSEGSIIWLKSGGSNENEESNGVKLDKNGNPYITGNFKNIMRFDKSDLYSDEGSDIFIIKYTKNGMMDWAQKAGGLSNDLSQGIDIDKDDNVYITGVFKELSRFGKLKLLNSSNGSTYDIFLAKVAPPVHCKCDTRKNIIKWQPLGFFLSYSRIAYERVLNDKNSFLIEYGAIKDQIEYIKDDTFIVSGILSTKNKNIILEYRHYQNQVFKGFFYGPFLRAKWGENKFSSFGEQGLGDETKHYEEKNISAGLGAILGYQYIFKNCITIEAFIGGYLKFGSTYDRKYFSEYDSDESIQIKFPEYRPYQRENTGLGSRFGIKLGYAF